MSCDFSHSRPRRATTEMQAADGCATGVRCLGAAGKQRAASAEKQSTRQADFYGWIGKLTATFCSQLARRAEGITTASKFVNGAVAYELRRRKVSMKPAGFYDRGAIWALFLDMICLLLCVGRLHGPGRESFGDFIPLASVLLPLAMPVGFR